MLDLRPASPPLCCARRVRGSARASPAFVTALGLAAFAASSADRSLVAQEQPPAALAGEHAAAPAGGRLRAIRIRNDDVFVGDDRQRLLPGLVNALHVTTRADVVRREIWFAPGDFVDAAMAAELERNLRALSLFAEVAVTLVATDDADVVDLVVATRDRLSLFFGGGASYVGGVAGFNVVGGEGNLFGSGDRLAASFRRNSDGESRGSLAYTDLHLLDSPVVGALRLSRTDVGDSIGVELDRPFKHLADPRSWRVAGGHEEGEVDYYRAGELAGEVPRRTAALSGRLLFGSGPRDARDVVGLVAMVQDDQYGTATGSLAPSLRVPGDTFTTFAGATAAADRVADYRKVTGLDTLDYVQDLVLGTHVEATLGARLRDEDGRAAELEPELAGRAHWASEPFGALRTYLGGGGGLRWAGGDVVGWSAGSRAQAFLAEAPGHTLALSVTFDAVEESQDLPVELTLGEDNGLRGYDARVLSGTRRLRANFEQRTDTGLELWTLRFGLCAFADAGWVGRGHDLGDVARSVGAGLRVGSVPLLGASVLRVDAAYPLDDVLGNDGGWTVSVSMGQVFTFGGNAQSLTTR